MSGMHDQIKASIAEVGAFFEDIFEPHQLDELESLASFASEAGENSGNKIRHCKVAYLDPSAETKWLFDTLMEVSRKANQTYFRFMLFGVGESLQLLRYESEERGQYGWHSDMGGGVGCRKLSFSLQLSSPEEYDGGDLLLLKAADHVLSCPRKRGSIAFFPSYQTHGVSPVTRGTRHALVGWINGPAFR